MADADAVATSSLYERLGGVYAIATVVDDFIDRVMTDPRLNANPRVDEAHHKVPPAGFKYLVTEMLCWAAGGPQRYTGRDMASSHRHLAITAGEWDAFMDDLAQTLDRFQVPTRRACRGGGAGAEHLSRHRPRLTRSRSSPGSAVPRR